MNGLLMINTTKKETWGLKAEYLDIYWREGYSVKRQLGLATQRRGRAVERPRISSQSSQEQNVNETEKLESVSGHILIQKIPQA